MGYHPLFYQEGKIQVLLKETHADILLTQPYYMHHVATINDVKAFWQAKAMLLFILRFYRENG